MNRPLLTWILAHSLMPSLCWAINNGQLTGADQWPEVVGISTENDNCSGVFIAKSVLLTAAHCVIDEAGRTTESIDVSLDDRQKMTTFRANKIIVHPEFHMGSKENTIVRTMSGIDIAILELSSADDPIANFFKSIFSAGHSSSPSPALEPADEIGAIVVHLNTSETDLQGWIGDPITIVGLGNDANNNDEFKKSATGTLASVESYHAIMSNLTAAQGTVCPGDSGGGVFRILPDGEHLLIGLSSGILNACTEAKQTSIAIDIAPEICWIQGNTGINLDSGCASAVPQVPAVTGSNP